MDMEELETGSGDTVNRVDGLLVGLGVALIGIWGTFATLIVKPSRLSPSLTGQNPQANHDPTAKRYLGPGVYFILSLLIFILIMHWLKVQAGPSVDPRDVSEVARSSTGYKFGYALAQLVDSFQQRLASGNIWSAVIIVVPIFAFCVALALINRILIGFIAPRWTAAHAVGAALYHVGTIILWMGLVVLLTMVLGQVMPKTALALLGGLAFLTVLGLTGVQAYQFAAQFTDRPDHRLGFVSATTPITIIGLIVIFIMLTV